MSLEEIARDYRPIMEADGYEYTLDDESAAVLAQRMQRAAQLGNDRVADAAGPEGEPELAPTIDSDEPRDAHDVFGNDTRANYTSMSDQFPFNLTAVMYRYDDDPDYPEGSGFKLINHHTMVTAAHVMMNANNGNWYPPNDIQFSARSPHPRGRMGYCYKRIIPNCFKNSGSLECDWGVIQLRRGVQVCDFDDYNVGYYGYRTHNDAFGTLGSYLWVVGYPNHYNAERPPGNWQYPSQFVGYTYGGNYFFLFGVYYQTDTSEGQSGGPVAHSDYTKAIAIHSQGYPSSNAGAKFTSSLIDWFESLAGW